MFSKEEYQKRREKLKNSLSEGIILFLGNEESSINFKDNWYPFRQDSTFLYFFGLNEPNLIATIDLENGQEVIYGDDLSIDDIVFTGPVKTISTQAHDVGIINVKPLADITSYLNSAIASKKDIHFISPYRASQILKLSELLQIAPKEVSKQSSAELIKAIVQLREIKSDTEIVEIEKAVNITVDMQYKAMEMVEDGMSEADLYGAVHQIALAKGNQNSFQSIVTKNGQILHNHYHKNKLKIGDMVLCDCGAESYSLYAGDLTRTFPVDKKFTAKQKVIYNIVYDAYLAAVNALKPDVLFKDVHLKACEKITEGLIEIGLMKGNIKDAVEAGAHTVFFQCGLGHMMGLDVHDMENLGEQYVGYTDSLKQSVEFGFKSLRLGKALKAGMVLTIEPGIYFIKELILLRKSQQMFMEYINYELLEAYFEFGGIRLEDDFVITNSGSRLLGRSLPTSSKEIEDFRTNKIQL